MPGELTANEAGKGICGKGVSFHRLWERPIYGRQSGMLSAIRCGQKWLPKADYPWSSAAAHCGLKDDAILNQRPEWKKQCDQISSWSAWSAWLAAGDEPEKLEILRRNIEKGLPCGAEKFIRELEKIAGRSLCYRPLGHPKIKKGERPLFPSFFLSLVLDCFR